MSMPRGTGHMYVCMSVPRGTHPLDSGQAHSGRHIPAAGTTDDAAAAATDTSNPDDHSRTRDAASSFGRAGPAKFAFLAHGGHVIASFHRHHRGGPAPSARPRRRTSPAPVHMQHMPSGGTSDQALLAGASPVAAVAIWLSLPVTPERLRRMHPAGTGVLGFGCARFVV